MEEKKLRKHCTKVFLRIVIWERDKIYSVWLWRAELGSVDR